MDETHVGRSIVQLRQVVDAEGEHVAAACMLLAEAGSDMGTISLEEQVALLEKSVSLGETG